MMHGGGGRTPPSSHFLKSELEETITNRCSLALDGRGMREAVHE
jgi:hypothetical protein